MSPERPGNPFAEPTHSAEHVAATPESRALRAREKAMTAYIEGRVLAGIQAEKLLDPEELKDLKMYIEKLTSQEKVEALYSEVVVYSDLTRELGAENIPRDKMDIDPLLLARLSLLWEEPSTRTSFLSRYAESREVDREVRLSAIGQEYHRLSDDLGHISERFEHIEQSLFTGTIQRADKVRSAKLTAERLINSKHGIEDKLNDITTLKDRPATPENTNLAASIMFDRLARYSDEAKSEHGFIWLPYFEEMLRRGVEAMQNGRWPMLIGESGTGKSEVAEAIIRRLSGTEAVMVACTPRLSEMDLVMRQEGQGVYTYGALMQAATGYERSNQEERTHETGRIVRFDEFLRLGDKAFAPLKRARQLKSGSTYEDGKKVLPGFGGIGTSNPPGRRYPENRPMDAAFEREFATIRSDFPPMTNENPELYEALLGALLDAHHHTEVHPNEIGPHYRLDESEKGKTLKDKIQDPITGAIQEKELGRILNREALEDDPTNPEHGILWRFSHFIRAIQDAYSLGNANPSDPVPGNVQRYNTLPDGTLAFHSSGSEVLRLERATMTLEIKSWMSGYRERKTKDSKAAHTKSLTEWLQYKLTQYIESLSDDADREKIQALANHFHLTDTPRTLVQAQPLTPLLIGKLSPRVPRPYKLDRAPALRPAEIPAETKAERSIKTYTTEVVVMEDGSEINLSRDPATGFEFKKDGKSIQIRPGSSFVLDSERFIFAGQVEHPGHALDGKLLVQLHNEALHRTVRIEDIVERAEEFDAVFVVSGSLNPYREALLEAGLPDNEATAETKEMLVNISEEIRRQTAVYVEVRDAAGAELLKAWVDDIENQKELITDEVTREYAKIQERIKAGMIPVVMPSRKVQEKTWETATTNLKPVWMKSGAEETVNDAYLYEEYKKQKMKRSGFFKNLPDRPYLVWTHPGQKPSADTCSKTFDAQQEYYAELVREHPDLYDPTDLTPTEYLALQATFTHGVREKFKKEQGEDTEPTTIKPLDQDTYTRFLSAGAFSDGDVPIACFHPDSGYQQLGFSYGNPDADGKGGFRPAARS